jgi:hypothetical protein
VVRQGAAAFYELPAIALYAWNKRRERRRAQACRATVTGQRSGL